MVSRGPSLRVGTRVSEKETVIPAGYINLSDARDRDRPEARYMLTMTYSGLKEC